MVVVDLVELEDCFLVPAVVRGRVERPVRAAQRVDAARRVAPHLEREDAGHVALEGERLHVEHQLDVLVERVGNAGRRLGQLPRLAARVALLDALDAPLDLADVVQVALHPAAVRRAQLARQLRDPRRHPVEDARVGLAARGALLGRAAHPEELLEGDPRRAGDRQRLGRRRPTDRIGVDAGVAVGATAGLVDVLDAELHRRQRRVLSEALRVDLVQRRAGADVRALRLLRMRLGQEDRAGPEVVAADLRGRERFRHPDVGVADDGQVLAVRLERAQRAGAQVEAAARLGRGPQVLRAAPGVGARGAVHHLHADQAGRIERGAGGRGYPAGRMHRIQEGQGQRGGADVTEKSTPRDVLASDVHESVSPPVPVGPSSGSYCASVVSPSASARCIRNAGLSMTPRMNEDMR